MSSSVHVLPEEILAEILSYLDVFERISAAKVCCRWKNAVLHPNVWKRISLSFDDFGAAIYTGEIENFIYNIVGFCRFLELDVSQYYGKKLIAKAEDECLNLASLKITKIVKRHESFCYSFIETDDYDSIACILKSLIKNNVYLESIDIENIQMGSSNSKVNDPLPFGPNHAKMMKTLRLVSTVERCSPSTLMYLVNLTQLTITPKFLHFSLIKHLAEHSLKCLNLVDRPKLPGYLENLRQYQWEGIVAARRDFQVKCFIAKSMKFLETGWCQCFLSAGMPVSSFVCIAWYCVPYADLLPLIYQFSDTLQEFVDVFTFHDEPDEPGDWIFLDFVKNFSKLHTLSIRLPTYAGTLLLAVSLSPHLKNLPIREDMVFMGMGLNLQDIQNLSGEQQNNILANCDSRELLENEMSLLLGKPWKLMGKDEYFNWMRTRYKQHFGAMQPIPLR